MEIKEIFSKKQWECFISSNSPVALFQSWNWGEVMISNSRQRVWRWGIYDKNNLIGIAQVIKVPARRGTFLHIRHGPIFSSWNKKYLGYFIDKIKNLAREQKASFIRISPLIANNSDNSSLLRYFSFRSAPIQRLDAEVCWLIDLSQDEETIYTKMRKTTRYLIRKAEKLGVKIIKTTDIKELDRFMKLYQITAQRQHFVQHKGIVEEFEIFSADKQIVLFEGFYKEKLLSAAIIIFYQNQAIYHHSASIEQKIPVNYLLQWEVIKEAKKRRMRIYNMWGITESKNFNHPWRGLTMFKQGFGGEKKEYLHASDLPLSFRYCTTFIVETLRRITKGF